MDDIFISGVEVFVAVGWGDQCGTAGLLECILCDSGSAVKFPGTKMGFEVGAVIGECLRFGRLWR